MVDDTSDYPQIRAVGRSDLADVRVNAFAETRPAASSAVVAGAPDQDEM